MQRWRIRTGVVVLGALLAAGSFAASNDPERGTAPSAAPGLVVEAPNVLHVPVDDGEAGSSRAAPERIEIEPALVPEPTTLVLFGSGLAGLVIAGRRRRA